MSFLILAASLLVSLRSFKKAARNCGMSPPVVHSIGYTKRAENMFPLTEIPNQFIGGKNQNTYACRHKIRRSLCPYNLDDAASYAFSSYPISPLFFRSFPSLPSIFCYCYGNKNNLSRLFNSCHSHIPILSQYIHPCATRRSNRTPSQSSR